MRNYLYLICAILLGGSSTTVKAQCPNGQCQNQQSLSTSRQATVRYYYYLQPQPPQQKATAPANLSVPAQLIVVGVQQQRSVGPIRGFFRGLFSCCH